MPDIKFPIVEGRDLNYQLVHFLRKDLNHDSPLSGLVGVLPYNALIVSMKCYVITAFANSKLTLGKGAEDKTFGEKEIKTVSVQDYTPTADKAMVGATEELRLHYKKDVKSNAGKCVIIVEFIPNL